MKLFLSSMHPSNGSALLNLFDDQDSLSAVIVPTGWDTYPTERKDTELKQARSTLEEFGFNTSLLDLTKVTKNDVQGALTGKSLVWVMAGNTFYLNFYLHRSGFAEVIRDQLADGLVYGGESAGAVVAGITLHGVEEVDDPKESPEVIWAGLSLVDHGVLPHADWDKYQEAMTSAKVEMEKFTKVVAIGNNQALLITDGQETMVENISNED